MKHFISTAALLLSFSAFSQSYLILSNGVTLTTDKAGFVYDFGHFFPPYKINLHGGQFLVEEDQLSTIDDNGFLYTKDLKVKKTKGAGLNYIINNDGSLVTIDNNGYYYILEGDGQLFRKPLLFGGNFFTVNTGKKKEPAHLYTVNNKGNYFKVDVPDLNPLEITKTGGKFFQVKSDLIYTVNKDGFVFAKPEIKVAKIKSAGGNFFIDETNKLYTVSEDGYLFLPILPANIVIDNLVKFGANYMIDNAGRIFVVDHTGAMFERSIPEHNLLNSKITSF